MSAEYAKEDQYQESVLAVSRAAKAGELWENHVRDSQTQRIHNGNCSHRGEL